MCKAETIVERPYKENNFFKFLLHSYIWEPLYFDVLLFNFLTLESYKKKKKTSHINIVITENHTKQSQRFMSNLHLHLHFFCKVFEGFFAKVIVQKFYRQKIMEIILKQI